MESVSSKGWASPARHPKVRNFWEEVHGQRESRSALRGGAWSLFTSFPNFTHAFASSAGGARPGAVMPLTGERAARGALDEDSPFPG
jgi:hypothetical protein